MPRKNLVRIGGVPLVVRAIRAALQAKMIDHVAVSTDDREIAEVSADAGAEIIHRPDRLSGDLVSSEETLIHAIQSLDQDFDVLALIQCTSPFIDPRDIDGTVELVVSGEAESAFTATVFHGFVWAKGKPIRGVNHDPRKRARRQDLPAEYLETGAVYAMLLGNFLKKRHRFFGRTAIYEVPPARSVQIDTWEDVEVAEYLSIGFGGPAVSSQIDAIAMDFDGVFTDNRVILSEDGVESVVFDRSDGLAIEIIRGIGIPMMVLSSEVNPVVARRCKKLGLPFRQSVQDKAGAFQAWVEELGLDLKNAAFVGNDVNDLPAMRSAGHSVAPADGHPAVLREASVVLRSFGGRGAISELAHLLQEARTRGLGFGDHQVGSRS